MPEHEVAPEPEARISRVVSRRSLLAAVPGLALMAAEVSCGSDNDDDEENGSDSATPTTAPAATQPPAEPTATSESEPDSAGGEWTFTDDRGVTITLPKPPERVVAYIPIAASLWDFGVRPVGVFGTTVTQDGSPEVYSGNVDLDAVVSLGEVYGEMDLEQLVELKPDLILFDMYWEEIDLWGLPADAVAQVEEIAPIFGVRFINQPITTTVGTLEKLAADLGADLDAPDVVEARTRFESAAEAVQAACAEKPELTALLASGWTDNLYIANPKVWADLIYFQELGLNMVMPDVPEGELWETLSWEQAGKYSADLILHDARSAAIRQEQLADIATWSALPAVQADQVHNWYTEFVPSYLGLAEVLEDLATAIEESSADVV